MKLLGLLCLALILSGCANSRKETWVYPASTTGWNTNTAWVSTDEYGKNNSIHHSVATQHMIDSHAMEAAILAEQSQNEHAIEAAKPSELRVEY